MSKTQLLRMLINERLSAAATEIFGVVERTIAEYEEEVRYSKKEIARQRELLNAILKPDIRLHRTDPQKFTLCKQVASPDQQPCEQERSPSLDQEDPERPQIKEEIPPEQQLCEQERSPSLDQENPELPQIKEEQEELWTSQEGDQLQNLKGEETDTKDSMQTITCVRSLSDKDQTQSSHLDPCQSVDNREGDPVATTSTEPDGEDCGGPESDCSIAESEDSEFTPAGDKPYNCHVCSRTFNVKSSLKSHMVSHTATKPFSCSVCGKEFKNTHQLTVHMRDHTGEKPFKCSLCSKEFARRGSLDYHMLTHTGARQYNCSFCEKRFYNKNGLTRHMIIHTGEKPFKCTVCAKGFNQRFNLKSHMRTHTEEWPYSCSVCKKSFNRKYYLTLHMPVHTEEKPFKCSICSRGFSLRSSVKIHMKVHSR